MAHKHTDKTARIDLDITAESQRQFAALHKALGFKNKAQTFEAIVFSVSAQDIIQPGIINRIESKLNQTLEILDALT